MLKGVTNCCCNKFTSSDRSSDRSSLGEFEQLMSSSSIYCTSTRFKGSKVIATSRDELNIQKLPRNPVLRTEESRQTGSCRWSSEVRANYKFKAAAATVVHVSLV